MVDRDVEHPVDADPEQPAPGVRVDQRPLHLTQLLHDLDDLHVALGEVVIRQTLALERAHALRDLVDGGQHRAELRAPRRVGVTADLISSLSP